MEMDFVRMKITMQAVIMMEVCWYTGWISEIWKKVQAKILKEPLVLVKQTIPVQKALDLSFNLAP